MATDIQILPEQGVIRVIYRGAVLYHQTVEMLRQVAGIAAGSARPLVLFDIRDADYENYQVNTIRHAEEGPALGIDNKFRIAFLAATDNSMLQFIENATVNRGFQTKVFTNETQALAWLRSTD